MNAPVIEIEAEARRLVREAVDYLRNAGVEPSRLAVAGLATDVGASEAVVAAMLAAFDAEADNAAAGR